MIKAKSAGALLLSSASLLSACGKDEADFNSLKDQVGVINGSFNLRLGSVYRDKIDAMQAKLDDVIPGASSLLLFRFQDEGSNDTGSGGVKFSDLLKLAVPGTNSKIANQLMFAELQGLTGDGGVPYFDLVDNNKYVKKPYYVAATGASADTNIGDQYYLDMIRWKEGVALISDAMLTAATPVVVAVLDTGVNAAHPELKDVMWMNTGASVGYDAGEKKALGISASTDVNGHGTHVAGIIAGAGSNGKGIHGIAGIPKSTGTKYLAEIMNIKVLNDNGAGTSEEISTGIKWAVDQHKSQKNTVTSRANQKLVINMSLGGPFDATGFDFKQENGKLVFEDDMINYAASNSDVLVVVAAGNDTCGIGSYCDMYNQSFAEAYYFPCSYKNVLCVAATTHEDEVAGFSNRRDSVGIAAPGYQILSTSKDGGDNYEYYSGTSQATPVTSGAAAVVWSMYPDFTGTQIKEILRKSASKISTVTKEILSGDGRLNLEAAMKYAAQLKAAGKGPADLEPDAAILSTSPVTPAKQPASGSLGPKDPSPNAQPGAAPESKGEGSADGCAVVGTGQAGGWFLLFGLILPLCCRRRRS
jgi:subtilisin family serine protease